MFVTIFLLVLLFIFVVRPIWRVYSAVRRQQRQTRDFFRSMGIDPDDARNQRRQQQQQPPKPPRKKKIDSTVGEYIDYEEITVSSTQTQTSTGETVSYEVQQQITDVEWEEVK
ncbi:MAG: DUF4834 family protein [Muribaculaceae bacterium]|nr:DUF4834 family protein [Muribaculaceae bacterium]